MSLRRPSFENSESENRIDISPLIDIIFILLIFFIVTMVFDEKSFLSIKRPEAKSGGNIEDEKVEIFVDSGGKISLGGKIITLQNLRGELLLTKAKTAVIDADEKINIKSLVSIMDICEEVGLKNIYIATNGKEK